MPRIAALLLVLLPLGFAPACGGGSGSDPAPECTKPGTLRMIAVAGQPAPDTAGNFAAFPVGMLMDVAIGGWGAFVADTTDPAVQSGVWIVLPDGSARLAFAKGETAPDAGGGTITGFGLVRVNGAGQVLVLANVTGAGTRDFGLLTAQVVGGVVTGKNDVVYESDDMTATGTTGNLQTLDNANITFVDDGRVFFRGVTTTGFDTYWSANVDGTNRNRLVGEGSSVPNNPSAPTLGPLLDLRAVGVSRDGNRFAFVYDTAVGGALSIGTTGTSFYGGIAFDGQGIPDAPRFGSLLDVYNGGPLLVYDSGSVVWKAQGSASAPDDVLFIGSNTVPYFVLARTGDFASQAGGGTFGTLDLLQHRSENGGPIVDAQLIAVPNGVDSALYGLATNPPSLAMFEGRPAPTDLGQTTTFTDTDTFPGLNVPGYADVSRDGALAFAALLQNGTSGLFWLLPNCGLFTIAASGLPAPGGDTFGPFSPQNTHTTHNGVVLFRAPLTTASSGIFRHGP